jgi:hypothetical protein
LKNEYMTIMPGNTVRLAALVVGISQVSASAI